MVSKGCKSSGNRPRFKVNFNHCARFVFLSRAIDETDSSSNVDETWIVPQEHEESVHAPASGKSSAHTCVLRRSAHRNFPLAFLTHFLEGRRSDPVFSAVYAARPPPPRSLRLFPIPARNGYARTRQQEHHRGKGVPCRIQDSKPQVTY